MLVLHFAEAIDVVDVLLEVLDLLQLLGLVAAKEGVASGGLKQNQHSNYYIPYIKINYMRVCWTDKCCF